MARSLRDYSTPTVANVLVGPAVNTGNGNFELRTGLLTMVQANQFYGLPSEDANAHLQNFLELCETIIIIKDVVGYFKRKQKNPQAHGYRCSFHPGVFQSIDFPQEHECTN